MSLGKLTQWQGLKVACISGLPGLYMSLLTVTPAWLLPNRYLQLNMPQREQMSRPQTWAGPSVPTAGSCCSHEHRNLLLFSSPCPHIQSIIQPHVFYLQIMAPSISLEANHQEPASVLAPKIPAVPFSLSPSCPSPIKSPHRTRVSSEMSLILLFSCLKHFNAFFACLFVCCYA